jgi:hypothetical protein
MACGWIGEGCENWVVAEACVWVVALAASVIAFDARDGARAFDFFGLWGSDESPPPVSRTAISYAVTIDIEGGGGALKNAVTDASSLYRLRKDPPPDGDALAQCAESDFGPIIDAAWGAGYYNATVTISIDRASLSILSDDIAAFASAAESYRNRAAAPVTSRSIPGRYSLSARSTCSAPMARSFPKRNCRRGSSASSPAIPPRPASCARRRPGSSTISERKGARSPRSRRSPPSSITRPM